MKGTGWSENEDWNDFATTRRCAIMGVPFCKIEHNTCKYVKWYSANQSSITTSESELAKVARRKVAVTRDFPAAGEKDLKIRPVY